MNNIEIVRGTNGKVKSLKVDGTEVKATAVVVSDTLEGYDKHGVSEITIVMQGIVTGHTE